MDRKAKISLVSFPPLSSDKSDRLNKTLVRMGQYIDHAAELRSDLVAFPEKRKSGLFNPLELWPKSEAGAVAQNQKRKLRSKTGMNQPHQF